MEPPITLSRVMNTRIVLQLRGMTAMIPPPPPPSSSSSSLSTSFISIHRVLLLLLLLAPQFPHTHGTSYLSSSHEPCQRETSMHQTYYHYHHHSHAHRRIVTALVNNRSHSSSYFTSSSSSSIAGIIPRHPFPFGAIHTAHDNTLPVGGNSNQRIHTTPRTAVPIILSTTTTTTTTTLLSNIFSSSAASCSSSSNGTEEETIREEDTTTIICKSNNDDTTNEDGTTNHDTNNLPPPPPPPWSLPSLKSISSKTYSRFRQHVNPLSRRYSMAAELPPNWPLSVYSDRTLPLYLDIGCGKGGFLLQLAKSNEKDEVQQKEECYASSLTAVDDDDDDATHMVSSSSSSSQPLWSLPSHMNYLGLEIRPGVSQYAQARVTKHNLDGRVSFVGCNANVDLDRLLTLYHCASRSSSSSLSHDDDSPKENGQSLLLTFVSIQFPDPHFKKAHNKRRVVTSQLVSTLAKFMAKGSVVFLQSDILDVFVSMRDKFVVAAMVDEEEENNNKNNNCYVHDDGDKGDDDGSSTNMTKKSPSLVAEGPERYFDEIRLLHPREHHGDDNNEEMMDFGMANPLGIPTEREKSVLANGLPVYRTMFQRNDIEYNIES